jgi:hypothetical protein
MPTQNELNAIVRRGINPKRVYNALVKLTNSIGSGSQNVNIIRDMGDYDASTNLLPDEGTAVGSGPSGAIKRGDEFTFTEEGTFGGELFPVGTIARAKTDAPGQTLTNWRLY